MLDGSIPHVLVGSTMFEARVMDQVGSQDEAEGKALTELKSLVQQRPRGRIGTVISSRVLEGNLRMKEIFGWLVVWNMNFMTFHILGMSSSQLTFIFFRGLKPPTSWEKYNDLTVTSLEWCLVRGIIPKWPQVSGEWTMILYPEIWGKW